MKILRWIATILIRIRNFFSFDDPKPLPVPPVKQGGHMILNKYKGFNEQNNAGWIKKKWSEYGRTNYDHKTPWCGLAVAIGEVESGYLKKSDLPNRFERARDWLIPNPKYEILTDPNDFLVGDIIVRWRGRKSSTSGHCAYFAGWDKSAGKNKSNDLHKKYFALGGNQSDSITRKKCMTYMILGALRRKK